MNCLDRAKPAQALILAAGLSSRMGRFKPLLPLRGKTVVENAADSALEGGADGLTVVVGFRGEEVAELLRRRYGSRAVIVRNPEYAETDMLDSIRKGLYALPPCGAFFLLPGDMPLVRPETFRKLWEAWEESAAGAVFPALDGRRRHPPLIDARLIPALLSFQGADGLRGFWRTREEELKTVPVDDEGVRLDLDVPEAYRRAQKICEEAVSWNLSAGRQ